MHRTWKNGLPIMHVPATENYRPVQNRGWKVLLETVYGSKAGRLPSTESVMCARPALTIQKVAANGDLSRPYSTVRLWDAVDHFLQASNDLKKVTPIVMTWWM